jgi:hypothetical protein
MHHVTISVSAATRQRVELEPSECAILLLTGFPSLDGTCTIPDDQAPKLGWLSDNRRSGVSEMLEVTQQFLVGPLERQNVYKV